MCVEDEAPQLTYRYREFNEVTRFSDSIDAEEKNKNTLMFYYGK